MIGGFGVGGSLAEALFLQAMSFSAGSAMLRARFGCAALALPQNNSPHRALAMGGQSVCFQVQSGHDRGAHSRELGTSTGARPGGICKFKIR